MAAPELDNEDTTAARIRLSRWVLVVCGLVSLLVFAWVPFAHSGPFVSVIALPAFNVDSPDQPALVDLAEAVELSKLGPIEADGTVSGEGSLSPIDIYDAGAAMVDVSPHVRAHQTEVRIVGRYLQTAMLAFVLLGLVCVSLPLLLGAENRWTLAAVGGSALLVLAAHAMMIAFDLSGVTSQNVFTWESHTAAVVLVAGVGLGTVLPLTRDNVLAAIFGAMGFFVASGVATAIWIVAF